MRSVAASLFVVLALAFSASAGNLPYTIVDTGQEVCFDDESIIDCPGPGLPFYGQDAQYRGNTPRYVDNGDGTVTDRNTGLMWIQARGEEMSWKQAADGAAACRVGGYDDWRMPTIKELYSLIDFNGWSQSSIAQSIPFIDTDYLDFEYGDESAGERSIDCQDWSASRYTGATMGGAPTAFGVNFADGRIKGYPVESSRPSRNRHYVRYVRGNPDYGRNDFELQGAVVADRATSLVWQRADSSRTYDWQGALDYCENLELGGRSDWRLPNVKELQSIVDYTRSPTATGSAAVDPAFEVSQVESYYWSSTTHMDGRPDKAGSHAAYVAFGRAMGFMAPPGSSSKRLMDVHGAGAQRSDPKSGDPSEFPEGFGPQGDDRRIYNAVRCVAGGAAEPYTPPGDAGNRFERMGLGEDAGPAPRSGSMGSMQHGMGRQGGSMGMNRGPQQHGSMEGVPSSPGQHGHGMDLRRGGPGHGPQGGHGGPPKEAADACAGKAAGAICRFDAPHGEVRGECRSLDGQMACVP